jgi:hypothetical protein
MHSHKNEIGTNNIIPLVQPIYLPNIQVPSKGLVFDA